MNNTITVKIRNNYGVDYIYPVCPKAQDFAEIAGTKTLTPYVITVIKNLGFKVLVQPDTPKEL
jgi:hypothetical protein